MSPPDSYPPTVEHRVRVLCFTIVRHNPVKDILSRECCVRLCFLSSPAARPHRIVFIRRCTFSGCPSVLNFLLLSSRSAATNNNMRFHLLGRFLSARVTATI